MRRFAAPAPAPAPEPAAQKPQPVDETAAVLREILAAVRERQAPQAQGGVEETLRWNKLTITIARDDKRDMKSLTITRVG